MIGGWTHHGGRLAQARAAFGDKDEPWLDLSTGINPYCWSHADEIAIDWRHLPDERGLRMLEAAAAEYLDVDPAQVAAVPGTEIGLRLLGSLLPGPARHLSPSYRTHAEMFAESLPISPNEIVRASKGVVVLANPNNPDGHVHAKDVLLDLLERFHGGAGWLVVDEAFADADPGLSISAHVGDEAPLVIFRSFGKFFGLAGVRLGFMVGPRSLVVALRALLGAWPVSSAAIAIGTAAYRDHRWIATMRQRLMSEAKAFDAVLNGHGLAPIGGCPLFRLVEVDDAAAMFDRLARRAILTRPFDYNPRWLRIGLPGGNDPRARLERALTDG